MNIVIISGVIIVAFGLVTVIRGRMPFIKTYNGVKNISLHSRIEGSAAIICGLCMMLYEVLSINSVVMMVMILGICILTLVIEIVLKAI